MTDFQIIEFENLNGRRMIFRQWILVIQNSTKCLVEGFFDIFFIIQKALQTRDHCKILYKVRLSVNSESIAGSV